MPENPEPWREARGRKSDQGDYRPTTGRGFRHACFSAIMPTYVHQDAWRPAVLITGNWPQTTDFPEDPMSTKAITIGPKIKTALPGPIAKRVLTGDTKYISPSYTRSYPLVAKQGRGIIITDVDGNEFLDFSAGIAVTSTGHCHPDVVAAIQ